jgi:hypothetical protein
MQAFSVIVERPDVFDSIIVFLLFDRYFVTAEPSIPLAPKIKTVLIAVNSSSAY